VKDSKIQAKRDGLVKGKEEALRSQLKHEKEVNENRLKALAAAQQVATAPEVEEAPVAQAEEAPAVEAPAEEAPAADAAAEESTEA
jgi:small subunit ribosomal protein S16